MNLNQEYLESTLQAVNYQLFVTNDNVLSQHSWVEEPCDHNLCDILYINVNYQRNMISYPEK